MRGPNFFRNPYWIVLAAALSAAGMWLYTQRVLVAYQIGYGATHRTPRGNLSDLYPRWIGARELLVHGRDPYSAEVTRESQAGYYGRPLDPSRPDDPKDQQAFAYPIYVAFLLAPTVHLPFASVQRAFFWLLLGLSLATIPLWLRVLRMSLNPWEQASVMGFLLGSLALMQGLKLQQISLVVAAIVAAAIAFLVTDRPIAAGILLALSTIKPQLVWLLLLWLAIWTLADWRRRYRWAASFLGTMFILLAASEWYSPHWLPRFWHALGEYRKYTGAAPFLQQLVPAPWSWLPQLLAVAATLWVFWSHRRQAENTVTFATMICLVLAVTIFVVPTSAPYNQVLLLPPVLLLVHAWPEIWRRNLPCRVLVAIGAILLLWPWVSSVVLAGLSFVLAPEVVEKAWAVPLWTIIPLPMGVAALMLVHTYPRSFSPSAGHTTA
jgi:hypothetical protein